MSKAAFILWYKKTTKIDLQRNTLYNMHVRYITSEVENHTFTRQLGAILKVWDDDNLTNTGYPLLMKNELDPFNQKSSNSFVDKVYRTCLVYNKNFPSSPEGGWITLENYPDRINDLVRNKIACKFIDGPEILAKKIVELAEKNGLTANYSSRNYDDGYYAYHVYIVFPIHFDDGVGPVVVKNVSVEIQVSTQLKEVMYEILHKFYADERSKIFQPDWKWDIHSLKFKSGYLAHTIHLLEAMIVEVRNKL